MRTIINKDPTMRPKLVEFDRKHQSVMDKANQLKLQHSRPTESRSSNSNEGARSTPAGSPGTPSSPAKGCTQCDAPLGSCYECDKCHVYHTGGCRNTTAPEGESELLRRCKDCGVSASTTVPNPGAGKRDAPSGSDHGGSPSTPSGKGREPDPEGSNATKRRRGPGRAPTTDNIPTPKLPSSPEKDGKSFMLACSGPTCTS
ncbi:expressed unknown protein [Ectocarpus siliculosus]|uniref:Uncharacterized protein n=1 Tax=Ectocarpus siliculosus TaxID=2880 RepID=D7FRZ4_ECTSI|nr:expressed unknown protein [Ectocarpus siliculosus]|eukprot:CBJ30935.1 expressed unknown protein [Ectocarpus siliculosus]